jgi:F0F1-type ATP synthase membrane subunit b/b'
MAAINLVPSIPVIVGQGLVFGTAIYVVNKLIVKPYSDLRAMRDSLTTGSQSEAKSMFKEIDDKAMEIKTKRNNALDEAVVIRTGSKESASKDAEAIIAEARAKADSQMDSIRAEISEGLTAELNKVSSVVKGISDEIFELAVK